MSEVTVELGSGEKIPVVDFTGPGWGGWGAITRLSCFLLGGSERQGRRGIPKGEETVGFVPFGYLRCRRFPTLLFQLFLQHLHVQISDRLHPIFVDLHCQRSDQPQTAGGIREDPHH